MKRKLQQGGALPDCFTFPVTGSTYSPPPAPPTTEGKTLPQLSRKLLLPFTLLQPNFHPVLKPVPESRRCVNRVGGESLLPAAFNAEFAVLQSFLQKCRSSFEIWPSQLLTVNLLFFIKRHYSCSPVMQSAAGLVMIPGLVILRLV